MENVHDYIESGLLELYVLGVTSEKENEAILKMSQEYPAIKNEIEHISHVLRQYALQEDIKPAAPVKAAIMKLINENDPAKSRQKKSRKN